MIEKILKIVNWENILSWVLLHINLCRLFNIKPSLYIYIKYIWFGLVWFGWVLWHTNLCRLVNIKSLYTYVSNIYDSFGLVLWHINHCRLFNAKPFLLIYISYIWFGLVGFYGISTIYTYNTVLSTWLYANEKRSKKTETRQKFYISQSRCYFAQEITAFSFSLRGTKRKFSLKFDVYSFHCSLWVFKKQSRIV